MYHEDEFGYDVMEGTEKECNAFVEEQNEGSCLAAIMYHVVPIIEKIPDLTFGTDVRGDHALFMEEKHIGMDGWEIDEEAQSVAGDGLHFFRILSNGIQKHGHGWIDKGRICRWG